MGRDKRNEARGEHFAKLTRHMMQTPAWRALSQNAQALYPWLKLEWHGPKANNNGRIRLSTRQAAARMGCNHKTVAKAFHELQAKGFIATREPAHLGVSGAARSPAFELTELPLAGNPARDGRRLYEEWQEGKDFAVVRARTNNPSGQNGKNKSPCPTAEQVVPIRGTVG